MARAVIPVAVACALVAPGSASADIYNVTNTNDVAAANPNAGCATPNAPPTNGACTLRSAIQAANQVNGGSTINLAKGTYKLTIGPTGSDNDASGDLNIVNDVGAITINGAGSGTSGTVVDGNFTDRVFNVESGAVGATFNNLRITNGRTNLLDSSTNCPSNPQPNENDGGGILGDAPVTLNNDVITGNGTIGSGGGVAADSGSLTMKGTDVTNNFTCSRMFAIDEGGGIAVRSFDDIKIDLSNINNNRTTSNGLGGGIGISTCNTITVTNTTISGNSSGDGGGTYSEGCGKGSVTLNLFADLISGNTSSSGRPGIYTTGFGSQVNVTNTTVTGHKSGAAIGAGAGSVTMQYSTIAKNDVNIENFDSGTFTLGNSIVAQATSSNCTGGGVTAADHNLFDDDGTSCNAGSTDLTKKNPKLGSLNDNGGPTKTLALQLGSPAIDTANDSECSSIAKSVDQRGIHRPQGSHCDIGAFEFRDADLALTASASKDTIKVGKSDTVTDVIKNNGPSDDTNVTFSDPSSSANYTINSVTPAQGTCTHTKKTVHCKLGKLGKGKSTTVKIHLTGKSKGTITLNSSVSGALPDPNTSNNHATVNIKVIKPAAPQCGRSRFHFEYDTEDPVQDDRTTLVKVYVDGKHTETHHGHDIRYVHINPVPVHGTHHVVVIGFITDGRRIILTRTYHGCRHGPTSVHIEERHDAGPDHPDSP